MDAAAPAMQGGCFHDRLRPREQGRARIGRVCEERDAGLHGAQAGEQPKQIATELVALQDRAIDQVDRIDIAGERFEAQLFGGAQLALGTAACLPQRG